MLHGIRTAQDIVAQSPFAPWRERAMYPGADLTDEASLRAFLAEATGPYFHAAGTCAMGVGTAAVVTPELRVRGLAGLRVADASVMPTIVSVNTNAAAILIGEKAADLIREGAGQP